MTLIPAGRFCTRCGRPRTPEVLPGWLEDLLVEVIAKEAGMSPSDAQLKEKIARSRAENPEAWAALIKKI